MAALGDAEMMEAWLGRTQVLADVDLRGPLENPNSGQVEGVENL